MVRTFLSYIANVLAAADLVAQGSQVISSLGTDIDVTRNSCQFSCSHMELIISKCIIMHIVYANGNL